MATDLLFGDPPAAGGQAAHLVFGATEAAPVDVEATLTAVLPALTLAATVAAAALAHLAATLPPLSLAAEATVQPDIAAVVSHSVTAPWQPAAAAPMATAAPWHSGQMTLASTSTRWQEGERLGRAPALPWASGQALGSVASTLWRDGQAIGREAAAPWRSAIVVDPRLAAQPWRSGEQQLRPVHAAWRDGELQLVGVHAAWRQGSSQAIRSVLAASGSGRWGHTPTAVPWRPAAPLFGYGGSWVRVVPPDPPTSTCYVPGSPAHLVFDQAAPSSVQLLFRCDGHATGEPGSVITIKRIYMSVHDLQVVRLPDLAPIAFTAFEVSADVGEFGWSLTASGPQALLDQLSPTTGAPALVRISLDGMQWVFAIEQLQRNRAFAANTASVTGRSVTALLGAPYMAEQTWHNAAASTAQQAADGALDLTGVALSWGIEDWLLPAGAWTYSGTPLAAVQRVAEAAGAVVQSHRSQAQLQIVPRYPLLPWAWDAATPDVQLPLQVVTRESWERVDQPAWNGVYVRGQSQGVLALVKRQGSAGSTLAQMVTDDLVLADVVARQRGSAILGAAGPQARVALTLPVLTGAGEPGVIDVGRLVEVQEPTESWRGLVRSVSLSCSWPQVRQTIRLERHL